MFTKDKPRLGSAAWVLGVAWKAAITGSVMFIISGGYRDYIARQASRVSVEVDAPVPVRDLVASLSVEDRRQINCLARNAYYEAGNQGEAGMMAVGDVVFNRLGTGLYPGAICEVIFDGPRDASGNLVLDRCQFSWACDGKEHRNPGGAQWSVAYTVALKQYLYHEKLPDLTGGATRYHAFYVSPNWKSWRQTVKIGAHLFYKPEAKS